MEFAVGHGTSTRATVVAGGCRTSRRPGCPGGSRARRACRDRPASSSGMEALAAHRQTPPALRAAPRADRRAVPRVDCRRNARRRRRRRHSKARSRTTPAARHAGRGPYRGGLALLDDPLVLRAFRLDESRDGHGGSPAPRAGAGHRSAAAEPPQWRPFQLAFLLMNLRAFVSPSAHRPRARRPAVLPDRRRQDRGVPGTGGVRHSPAPPARSGPDVRRRDGADALHAAPAHAGPAWSRVDADLCARAGAAGDAGARSARGRSRSVCGWARPPRPTGWGRRARRTGRPRAPRRSRIRTTAARRRQIPLETCPWCGTRLKPTSFRLVAECRRAARTSSVDRARTRSARSEARTRCRSSRVDEPLYRRVPCFVIATVDKFASLPWVGRERRAAGRRGPSRRGRLLRRRGARHRAEAAEAAAAAGSHHPGRTAPDLRSARDDGRAVRDGDRRAVRAKGERTHGAPEDRRVHRHRSARLGADSRALRAIGRRGVPAAGADRRESFFADSLLARRRGRLYVGLAAQGRSLKVVLLRSYLALASLLEGRKGCRRSSKGP